MQEISKDEFDRVGVIAAALFGLCLLFLGLSFADEERADRLNAEAAVIALRDTLKATQDKLLRARAVSASLANAEVIITVDTRHRGEYFRFFRLNVAGLRAGYAIESNMKMDAEHLRNIDTWVRRMDSAGVSELFWVPTLFRESRVGLNQNHKLNRNGSIDGGWSGINSSHGLPRDLDDEINKFILLWRMKGIDSLDYARAEAMWMLGEKKYKEIYGSR